MVGPQEVHGLVVHHAAVIDRADAGADGRLDALGAVHVRGDVFAPARGLFGGDVHLLLGVLLRAGRRAFRKDGAGSQNLDEVGALLQIRAHGLTDFVGAVGQVLHDWHIHVDRKLPRIAGAAGGRDVVARRQQPRARDDIGIDGLSEVDVGVRPGWAHVAAGREAGHQRHERVVRAVKGRLPGSGPQQLLFPVNAGARQMGVQIDEARQQRGAAQLDDAGARRNRETAPDRFDSIAANQDDRRRHRRAAASVDQLRGADRHDGWRRGLPAGEGGQSRDREKLLHGADSSLFLPFPPVLPFPPA